MWRYPVKPFSPNGRSGATLLEVVIASSLAVIVIGMGTLMMDRLDQRTVGISNRVEADRQLDSIRILLKGLLERRMPDQNIFLGTRQSGGGGTQNVFFSPLAYGLTRVGQRNTPLVLNFTSTGNLCGSRCSRFAINIERRDSLPPPPTPPNNEILSTEVETLAAAVPAGWNSNLIPPVLTFCNQNADFVTERFVISIRTRNQAGSVIRTRRFPGNNLSLRSGLYSAAVCLTPVDIPNMDSATFANPSTAYNIEIIGFYMNAEKRPALASRNIQITRPLASPRIILR
jgi:hypothetical protein